MVAMLIAQPSVRHHSAAERRVARCTLLEVMSYENPDLVARYRNKLGLNEQEARLLFEETKRFLFLCGTLPGKWSPTKQIDEGWHNFILFTKDYAEFCQTHFGRFIHHNPRRIVKRDTDGASPAETHDAARDLFGTELSEHWSPTLANTVECSKSGCNCSPDTGGGGSECCPDYDGDD
jgi:hypothetical protein